MQKRTITLTAFFLLIISVFFLNGFNNNSKKHKNVTYTNLAEGFKFIPDSVKPTVYWYWISDNISENGVVKDLEAMKKVGIGRAYIGNIGLDETPRGKVKFLSDEWWKITAKAMSTATKLGIDIGVFNGPGWNQSGGPWVKPSESMRYLAVTEFHVNGPQTLNKELLIPYKNFQDVALLAFPSPEGDATDISKFYPKISSNFKIKNIVNIMDDDTTTVNFPLKITTDTSLIVDIKVDNPFTARSLTVFPAHQTFKIDCKLQENDNGKFKTLEKFEIDRLNADLSVGFMPFAPVCVSFPKASSSDFRLIFSNMKGKGGITELKLSESPRVERYYEKQLAKMFETPLPLWNTYKWPKQIEPKDKRLIIDPSSIINISKNLSKNGTINWKVPKGKWIILRLGMVPTGVTNHPATPEATGLEIDKMNKRDIAKHFDAFIGKILNRIPKKERRSFKYVVADSYETGPENWTDRFAGAFKKTYGYDPLKWLPVFTGRIVGSADQSNRFLWDIRRLIADLVANKYVGGLSEVSHKHGLKTWLENYGHWGFPSEFLKYGSMSDEVSGEFWAEGDLGSIELRDASSAAHIYGKTKVWAESFTAAGKTFERYPGSLKKRCDWAFTEGVNSTLLHVYIEQPNDKHRPGINAWFGTEFNRLNTWFNQSKSFIDYIRRCNFMLQQGKPVNDVAYFIGEDTPVMTGICKPALPKGYSFDYINADVIENRLSVKNNKLVLPDGISYRIMILPELKTMRPELLRKIRSLVREGATILGPSPQYSPSMRNYPNADKEVQKIARELWGKVDGKNVKYAKYGKGMIIFGVNLKEALNLIQVRPDFLVNSDASVLYAHRKTSNAEIYFITNQSDQTINIEPTFRIKEMQPELWNPITGIIRPLRAFLQNKNGTSIPIKMEPYQSWFIVFKNVSAIPVSNNINDNFPEAKVIKQLNGPWQVKFNSQMRGPESVVLFNKLVGWTERSEKNIKYYSGTADYGCQFNLDTIPEQDHILLDLGSVGDIANIKINGIEAGGLWTVPWQIDVTKNLKVGENKLEVEVTNTWVNRLIGDSKLPHSKRKTWTIVNPYNSNSPLEPSGLFGPVRLLRVDYHN